MAKRRPPAFGVDVEVEFEVAPDGDTPRWMLNRDMGYTDRWAQGMVVNIDEYAIEVFAFFPDGHTGNVTFPNYSSSDFEVEQWWYPGYLRPIGAIAPACDCGCDGLGYHWNFCQLKKWEEEQNAIQIRK